MRLVKLGRKCCELGNFDAAERYFREQEALWPGDTGRRAANLREVRKWAANVGDGKNPLTLRQQVERQRYLDFAARLERSEPRP